MLSKEKLEQEIKRYPEFIKKATKAKNWQDCVTLEVEYWTMRFVLETNDND